MNPAWTRRLAFVALILCPLLAARPLAADESSCSDEEDWSMCFERLVDELTADQAKAKTIAETAAKERLDNKTTPDSSGQGASSLGSFLPRVVTALGFGDLSEQNGSPTFKFNFSPSPENGTSPDQVILEVTRRDAEPLEALVMAIPEAIRSERKSMIEDTIGDFDDVEIKLSVAVETRGGNWTLGRSFGLYEDLSSAVFTGLAPRPVEEPLQTLLALFDKLMQSGRYPLLAPDENVGEARDENPKLATQVEAALVKAAKQEWENTQAFQTTLKDGGYFRLADLINNQPQLHFEAMYRDRDDTVGPSEWGIKATYEHGFGDVNGLRQQCKDGLTAPVTNENIPCYRNFLNTRQGKMKSANRLAVSAEYVDMKNLRFELPDDDFVFTLDDGNKWIVSGVYGRSLIVDDEGNDSSRLDVEAKYEDVTGDPMRQSRLVATATYTQNLFDGNVLSLSVVWAEKPEYRGEVDEEFSARAGLKFKIDKKKPKS